MSFNPLYWLHLRIGGSLRNNLVVVAVFAALVIVFSSISYSLTDSRDIPGLHGIWLMLMTGAQAIFLLLLAPAAVRRAVQRDFENGMIESHRLTPMSNLKVISGYISGAPVQAEMLYGVSLVFGTFFASSYALSPGLGGATGFMATLAGMCFAQGCLLMLSLMICSMILLSALATRGKANVIGIVVVLCLFGGWMAIAFVPGLSLLLGIMSGEVLYTVVKKGQVGGDASVIAIAAFLQLIFSMVGLKAACGQLRGLDRPLFSIRLGMVLLLVWGFTLVMGMRLASSHDTAFSEWREYRYARLVASTLAFVLVAYFPLAAAAAGCLKSDRASRFDAIVSKGQRRISGLIPLLLAALATFCMWMLFLNMEVSPLTRESRAMYEARAVLREWPTWLIVFTALLLSFWNDFHWLYFMKSRLNRPFVAFTIMLVVLKGLPLMLEGIAQFIVEEVGDSHWTGEGYLSGLSPIGTLILLPKGGAALWVGLIGQVFIAGVAILLASRARKKVLMESVGTEVDERQSPTPTPARPT